MEAFEKWWLMEAQNIVGVGRCTEKDAAEAGYLAALEEGMTQTSDKEQQELNDYYAVCMHNILAKIGKDKQYWIDLGYGQIPESVEDIAGNVLKVIAEVDCKVAITGIPK